MADINDQIKTVKEYENRVGIDIEKYNYAIKRGRRYIKVVAHANEGTSLRAVAFIDQATGSIFVAGSWTTPAKTRIA